jgi:hypothetical protein
MKSETARRAKLMIATLAMIEMFASQGVTAKEKAKKPPPQPHCTDSGLGGPICPFKFKGFLTQDQIRTLQQWNSQNMQELQRGKNVK